MNIILFTNRRGQLLNVELNPLSLVLVAVLVFAAVIGVSAYTGTRIFGEEPDYLAELQGLLREQQTEVDTVRLAAQADLDALTLRIGQLQAQMLRLNALGKRLVEQADFDGKEFDFDAEPAIGGPQTMDNTSVSYPDFLGMLEALDAGLEDRERKLSVLESMLLSKSVHDRVMPSGRPVEEGWLSSKFGKRSDPFSGKQEYHQGQDFAGKQGSAVIAVGDGVVTWAGERTGYGKLIEVNHGNGYATRYGHNQAHLVREGDTVRKGQQIALMGSTGRSTGPHVHFEVLHDGKQVNPAKFTAR